jgi:hypothetical protein
MNLTLTRRLKNCKKEKLMNKAAMETERHNRLGHKGKKLSDF